MTEKPSVTMPGTVEKIIQPVHPSQPVTDENGDEVRLKKGAEVEITVQADPEATIPKSNGKR